MSTTATSPTSQAASTTRRRSIVLVFLCTIIGTAAQLLMKTGMEQFHLSLIAILTNYPLIAGYVLYGINTVMLVVALKDGELSVLYPIIALTYVWVTLASYVHLHESPNVFKNVGVTAIILGVVLIGRAGSK